MLDSVFAEVTCATTPGKDTRRDKSGKSLYALSGAPTVKHSRNGPRFPVHIQRAHDMPVLRTRIRARLERNHVRAPSAARIEHNALRLRRRDQLARELGLRQHRVRARPHLVLGVTARARHILRMRELHADRHRASRDEQGVAGERGPRGGRRACLACVWAVRAMIYGPWPKARRSPGQALGSLGHALRLGVRTGAISPRGATVRRAQKQIGAVTGRALGCGHAGQCGHL